jgi:hypothetical protein
MKIQNELLGMLYQYFVEERFEVRAYGAWGVADRLAWQVAQNQHLLDKIRKGRGVEAIWVRVRSPEEHIGVILFVANGDLTVTLLALHGEGKMLDIDMHCPDSVEKLHALVNFYCNQQLAGA